MTIKTDDIKDVSTGFVLDKDTGLPVGLAAKPHLPPNSETEWPKWVVPHESQIIVKKADGYPDQISTPGFTQHHVNRADGVVTVLVMNEEEEDRAASHREEYAPVEEQINPDEQPVSVHPYEGELLTSTKAIDINTEIVE